MRKFNAVTKLFEERGHNFPVLFVVRSVQRVIGVLSGTVSGVVAGGNGAGDAID